MEKNKLINVIKQVIKEKIGKGDSSVSLDYQKFPILLEFPELKELFVDLLTEQYDLFIKDIQWVAPKPTTLKVVLANDQFFFLSYNERSWIAQVEGKKYYLLNLKEEENAVKAIAKLLKYGVQDIEKEPVEPEEEETPEEEEK